MSIDLSFFRSETSQRLRDEGRIEGRSEGRSEGRIEGRSEGVAGSILRILERRGVVVDDGVRERLTSCTDLALLERWLDRSLTVTSTAELFDAE
ncbi:hypothetical protein DFR70_102733 [Nocardia tenerifensis]|uniref:DUF4351 domain-containing protein n=1 Tax=Nocardia tenerifensis TaxID=228006 RepID=A0A318KKU9_9NOCA